MDGSADAHGNCWVCQERLSKTGTVSLPCSCGKNNPVHEDCMWMMLENTSGIEQDVITSTEGEYDLTCGQCRGEMVIKTYFAFKRVREVALHVAAYATMALFVVFELLSVLVHYYLFKAVLVVADLEQFTVCRMANGCSLAYCYSLTRKEHERLDSVSRMVQWYVDREVFILITRWTLFLPMVLHRLYDPSASLDEIAVVSSVLGLLAYALYEPIKRLVTADVSQHPNILSGCTVGFRFEARAMPHAPSYDEEFPPLVSVDL
jgi:hypothetical protein